MREIRDTDRQTQKKRERERERIKSMSRQYKWKKQKKSPQEIQGHFLGDNGSQDNSSMTWTLLWELAQTILIPQCQGWESCWHFFYPLVREAGRALGPRALREVSLIFLLFHFVYTIIPGCAPNNPLACPAYSREAWCTPQNFKFLSTLRFVLGQHKTKTRTQQDKHQIL